MNVSTHFHRQLLAKLEAEIARASNEAATGSSKSYDEYKFLVGYIHGLKRAMDMCEDVERTMD